MIIKVCGMINGENIRATEGTGADMIGMIFYNRSARFLHKKPDYIPLNSKRVGVFVNEQIPLVCKIANEYQLDYIQLHGNESPEYCATLNLHGLKIIKAISISTVEDIAKASQYFDRCNYLLFDTKHATSYGGTGEKFDWKLLLNYTSSTPFILSGGISLDDINALMEFTHPQLAGYDINSKFEISPGIKDITKIKTFIQQIKHHE